jgi:hypothetical protein
MPGKSVGGSLLAGRVCVVVEGVWWGGLLGAVEAGPGWWPRRLRPTGGVGGRGYLLVEELRREIERHIRL